MALVLEFFVFLRQKHKAAFLIERHSGSVRIHCYEATGTSAHCGEYVLDLQQYHLADLLPGIVTRYRKTANLHRNRMTLSESRHQSAEKKISPSP